MKETQSGCSNEDEELSKSMIWVTIPMLQPSIVASEAQQGWVTAIAGQEEETETHDP